MARDSQIEEIIWKGQLVENLMVATDKKTQSDNALGEFIKRQREGLGVSQADLATALGYQNRQIVSAIETGDRKIPLDKEKLEQFVAALKLNDSLDFTELILADLLPADLLALLKLETGVKGNAKSRETKTKDAVLNREESEIIYLKHCHDRLARLIKRDSGLNDKEREKERQKVTRAYQQRLNEIKDRLKEVSDDELLTIERATGHFQLIVPDLSYELPRVYATYQNSIKRAYARGAKYEYLLPATRPVYRDIQKYFATYGSNPEGFSCRFLRNDEWVAAQSEYYSGRCLYKFEEENDFVGIEYDRKRSAKNFFMTRTETESFKQQFEEFWEHERTLKGLESLERYLTILDTMDTLVTA